MYFFTILDSPEGPPLSSSISVVAETLDKDITHR